MQTPRFQSAKANFASRPKTGNAAPTYLLWVCLIAWAVSFFLPSTGSENGTVVFGWQATWTALLLFFIPVKGMWFGFFPHVLSVFANLFMLWAPFQVKRLKETSGRKFALAFTFASALPVTLL